MMMDLRKVGDGFHYPPDWHERLFWMRDANGRVCLAFKTDYEYSRTRCRILATFTTDDEWDRWRSGEESSAAQLAREICDTYNRAADANSAAYVEAIAKAQAATKAREAAAAEAMKKAREAAKGEK